MDDHHGHYPATIDFGPQPQNTLRRRTICLPTADYRSEDSPCVYFGQVLPAAGPAEWSGWNVTGCGRIRLALVKTWQAGASGGAGRYTCCRFGNVDRKVMIASLN